MLTVESVRRTSPGRGRRGGRVFAVYSFRHDAHLVPDMRKNLQGIVDGFVSFDDRASTETFSSEPARRQALLKAACEAGADWILAVDPDERFEPALRDRIDMLAGSDKTTAWSFAVREMYQPCAYRSDGIWNHKRVSRLFPAAAVAGGITGRALHGGWFDAGCGLKERDSGLNLYHLKMLTPARRQARRDLYAALDPGRAHNAAGYDYLADEHGLELTTVPEERMFDPPHVDDGGLWMAEAGETSKAPDPVEITLSRARARLEAGDSEGAGALIAGLSLHRIGDDRILRQTVGLMLDLWGADRMDALLAGPSGARIGPRLGFDLRLRLFEAACGADGARNVQDGLARLHRDFGERPELELAMLRHRPRPGETHETGLFTALGWSRAEVRIRWGSRADYGAAIATVVIGLHAPDDLRPAVQSLLDQSEPALIVVFNSGRGDLRTLLGGIADRVILVETPQRVFVGAARNIGASLVSCRFVAFLASDCLAEPGWIETRMALHAAGHRAVASSVTVSDEDSTPGWASHLLLFASRMPDVAARFQVKYGLSYDRDVFFACGWFDPDLRVGEDTAFNFRIRQAGVDSIFAPAVRTAHRPQPTLAAAIRDAFRRGRRSRVPAVLGGLRLRRVNHKIPGTLLRCLVSQPYRRWKRVRATRQGLVWPGNEAALRNGLRLLPVLAFAYHLGQVLGIRSELACRREAFRLMRLIEIAPEREHFERLITLVSRQTLGRVVVGQLSAAALRAGDAGAASRIARSARHW